MLFDHPLAWVDEKIYQKIYDNSIQNSKDFWQYHSQKLFWKNSPDKKFSNITYNAVDRHSIANPNKTALTFYRDNPNIPPEKITYNNLLILVKKIAKILKNNGIKKGDIVGIYMSTSIVSIATILACARIGAIHLVIFAGFSAQAMAYRLQASNAKILITQNQYSRNGKIINLASVANEVSRQTKIKTIIMEESLKNNIEIDDDFIEWCDEKDNLFVLYTSGTTGAPKGIMHSMNDYMLYIATTFDMIFGALKNDTYFCTSDIGWITGHSYMCYAPLIQGLTMVIFDGTPIFPDSSRYWQIIEKEEVSIFYTAPTALRAIRSSDESLISKFDLSSLKILGSVGEPIDESTWNWYFEKIGERNCPIMDTWWQTETGGIILAPLRNLKQIPSVAGKPFFGIRPKIINENTLAIQNNWPGRCRSVMYECEYSKTEIPEEGQTCQNIFQSKYFDNCGNFLTGDGARILKNNEIKIIGRIDDVINTAGHRLSTAEFEAAVLSLESVAECAVVPILNEIKGQGVAVFVVPCLEKSESFLNLKKQIYDVISLKIGPIAKPDKIIIRDSLPKTNSGKTIRSLLKE